MITFKKEEGEEFAHKLTRSALKMLAHIVEDCGADPQARINAAIVILQYATNYFPKDTE